MDKSGKPVLGGEVIFINDFQFKYHEASNRFEVYTGIPVPAPYEAQPADFDILLNYLPIEHPSHPRNTVMDTFSLVQSSVLAQLNGPSFGNTPELMSPTANHHLNVAKDNTTLTTFC